MVVFPFFCLAIAGVVYTWIVILQELRQGLPVGWRRTTGLAGVLAATVQLGLFVAAFEIVGKATSADGRVHTDVWTLLRWEAVLAVIAIGCALTRKGPTRWWLLYASVALAGSTGFVWVVSGIVF